MQTPSVGLKWPESVDDVVANRSNCAKMNSQVVHAISKGQEFNMDR